MHFISTRNNRLKHTLSEAILNGLALDGGLFIPEYFPKVSLQHVSHDMTYPEFSEKVLHEFFVDDPLSKHLPQICNNALNFPLTLTQLNHHTSILNLFHGPTLSFKDFGARFLAECLQCYATQEIVHGKQRPLTIMVATSGDTGSAVASAFYRKSQINVIILYPERHLSKRQQHQITCWDHNILALAVNGTFDDCQQLVKAAFQDPWWQSHLHLSSANSINIGRLLPQMTYYAYSSLLFYNHYHTLPGFVIPTGNVGNATAGYWAKMMGFPIREIVLATNANRVIPDYLRTHAFHPQPSIETLANAMDVGNPSNLERLQSLFQTDDVLSQHVKAISANDDDIRKTIQDIYQRYRIIICPHTATACFARQSLSEQPWIVLATADPSKFDTIIEPIIHTQVPIPPQLETLLHRPTNSLKVEKTLTSIQEKMGLPAGLSHQTR